MKILITGTTGFIGKNLVTSLANKNYDISIIARSNSDISKCDKRVTVFTYNENIDTLLELFQKEQFEGVVHLASLFLASHHPKDIPSLISSNIKFGTELLEACKLSNVKWFINTGTFWQNFQNQNYNPVNLYAATKEAFENIAKYYTETSDLTFTTIKLNDTFGPNDTRNKIFNLWNTIAKSGETLDMSKGEQLIDISYIEDVISAYEILINHLNSNHADTFKNKTFALRAEECVSLKELANIFEKATNTKLNINWGIRPYREREVINPWNKGELVPGWEQKYSLEEAIQKTMIGIKK